MKNPFPKKKIFFVLLPIILAGAILYPTKTYAIGPLVALAIGAALAPIVTSVVGTLVAAFTFLALIQGIQLVGLLFGGAVLKTGIGFLKWGINGGPFAFWSMTNPANNRIIEIGWTLLRDITNMFFILGLAYIGLATALNLGGFNTKKVFSTLLIMALLINFTPVICGLIIDASNIVMNFFFSEVNFNKMADVYEDIIKAGDYAPIQNKEDLGAMAWFVKFILLQFYSFGSGIVMLIFAAILLLRHFIIWVLVIMSPLAFFCRIFDFSKQWFSKWWNYFISWAFIGVPAAFFLYLGNHLLVLAESGQIVGTAEAMGFYSKLSPYLVSMLFLIIALISTLKIRAAGSGFIIGAANKLVRAPGAVSSAVGGAVGAMVGTIAGAKIGAAGLRGQKPSLATKAGQEWLTAHPTRAALAKASRFMFGKKSDYTTEELEAGAHKKWYRVATRAVATPLTLGAPIWGRTAQYQAAAIISKQLEAYGKGAVSKDASLEEKRAAAFTEINPIKRIKNLRTLQESGDFGDVYDLKNKAHRDRIHKDLEWALKNRPEDFKKLRLLDYQDKIEKDKDGNIVEIRKSITHELYNKYKEKLSSEVLDAAGLKLSDDDKSFYGHGKDKDGKVINRGIHYALGETDDEYTVLSRKIIGSIKAGDVALMSKGSQLAMLKSDDFQVLGNQAMISKVAENFAREAVDAMNDIIEKKTEQNPNFYINFNQRLHKSLQSSASQALGIQYSFGKVAKEGIMRDDEMKTVKEEADKELRKLLDAIQKAEEKATQEAKTRKKRKKKKEKTPVTDDDATF